MSIPSPTGNPATDVTLIGFLLLALKELAAWFKADRQSDESMVREFIHDLKADNRSLRDSEMRLLESIYESIGKVKQIQAELLRSQQQGHVDMTGLVANQKVIRDMIVTLSGNLKSLDQKLGRLHERLDNERERDGD